MDWRTVLERAAPGRESRKEMLALRSLLRRAVSGDYSETDVVAAFDAELWRVPYLQVVERRLWNEPLDEVDRQSARAALVVLTPLMDRLRTIIVGARVPSEQVQAALERLVVLASAPVREVDGGGVRCPRCGSSGVDTRHTNSSGVRAYEAGCEACGYHSAWSEDTQPVHPWLDGAAAR
jgi:hypothetical protein